LGGGSSDEFSIFSSDVTIMARSFIMIAKKAKSTKEKSFDAFMSHKVKNYAEYCEFMKPRNTDISINSLGFSSARQRRSWVQGR
jgi:hypothetical protein